MLKMPTAQLSQAFSNRLAEWVTEGGRLIVVADHTDLYDSAQNLNGLLGEHFGALINADAVYNATGMPTVPTIQKAGMLVGRIDAHGYASPWQTGASMKRIPYNAVELATFGASFAEPGDYSRPNRFGPFIPNLGNRYFNHSSVVAFGHGKGAVAIVLDSTPWSNFSIFKEQYVHLFRALLDVLSKPHHIQLLGWTGLAIALFAFFAPLLRLNVAAPVAGALVGTALTAGGLLGLSSIEQLREGRDFGVKIIAGQSARLEFLKQILMPGERNFARIVSSLGKYELLPISTMSSTEAPRFGDARRWLLIQPDAEQLPTQATTLHLLRSGVDMTVIFGPEQATSPAVLKWLSGLGLMTQRSVGLMVSDASISASGSLIGGRSPALGRETRVVTVGIPTSLLNTYETDQYFQTYTARPTTLPRASGFLTISFASDQFTDDAVGEVWEGIHPSSVGRLREAQLAAILLGKERPPMFPDWLKAVPAVEASALPGYVVIENGTTKLSGRFAESNTSDPVVSHIQRLRDQSERFVATHCPRKAKITECSSRLLGEDYVEWMVSWRSTRAGQIEAIELLHERRMSGLGSTWNIVFAN